MIFKIIFGGIIGGMIALFLGFLTDCFLERYFPSSTMIVVLENSLGGLCFAGFILGALLMWFS